MPARGCVDHLVAERLDSDGAIVALTEYDSLIVAEEVGECEDKEKVQFELPD